VNLWALVWTRFLNPGSPTNSTRMDNALNRTSGICVKVLYKPRMISSTYRYSYLSCELSHDLYSSTSRDAVFFGYHCVRYLVWVRTETHLGMIPRAFEEV
jgi:hypothetical protein